MANRGAFTAKWAGGNRHLTGGSRPAPTAYKQPDKSEEIIDYKRVLLYTNDALYYKPAEDPNFSPYSGVDMFIAYKDEIIYKVAFPQFYNR